MTNSKRERLKQIEIDLRDELFMELNINWLLQELSASWSREEKLVEAIKFTIKHTLFFDRTIESLIAFSDANPNTPVWEAAEVQLINRQALSAHAASLEK